MFNFIRKVNRELAETGYSTVRCEKEFFIDLENVFEKTAAKLFAQYLEKAMREDDG